MKRFSFPKLASGWPTHSCITIRCIPSDAFVKIPFGKGIKGILQPCQIQITECEICSFLHSPSCLLKVIELVSLSVYASHLHGYSN